MTKAELISAMAAQTGLSKTDSRKAVEAFIATVTDALAKGERVSLLGFGHFSVCEREARCGFNPTTRENVTIAARKTVKFKPGKELAETIDQ